jgi:hypothetical protein
MLHVADFVFLIEYIALLLGDYTIMSPCRHKYNMLHHRKYLEQGTWRDQDTRTLAS